MNVHHRIGGKKLYMKNFRMGVTAIAAGVPVISDADTGDTSGVLPDTTTGGLNLLGLSINTAAASTAAQVAAGAGDLSDGNNASFTKVCINPDAIYRAKLNNGATEDTALAIVSAAQAASADGLTVTGATDEATVWGYKGANVGHNRFTTAAATVVIAFPNDIAALDEFLEVLLLEGSTTQTPTLTAAFTQIDATAAVAASDNYTVVGFQLRDSAHDGLNKSFALIVPQNHAYGNPGIVA